MITWTWQDLGGRTDAEHIVTGYDGIYSVFLCGIHYAPEPKKDKKQKNQCKACIRSLLLHAEVVARLSQPFLESITAR